MTNTMSGKPSDGIKTIHSKIDYTLCSVSLAARVSCCTIDHSPRDWAEAPRSNYHAALVTCLDWSNLWATPADGNPEDQPKVQGHKLNAYPNYSRLNKVTAAAIAERVSKDLHGRFRNLRGIWNGRKSNATKRDELLRILKAVILKAAHAVLGTVRETSSARKEADVMMSSRWESLCDLVRRALGHTLHSHVGPRVSFDGPEIANHRAYFATQGVALPDTPGEWRRWWAKCDDHKADAMTASADMITTDKLALSDPKRFYRETTKPFSSSKIPALRTAKGTVTSDAGIEMALTDYLRHTGKQPPAEEERSNEPSSHAWSRKRSKNSHLLSAMMDAIDMPTMTRITGTLDSTSAPGYDGISPALLKAVLTSTWTERVPRGPMDDLRERIDLKFNTSFQNMRDSLGYREGTAQALRRMPNPNPYRSIIKEPNLCRQVLLRILNLCLLTRDIPAFEKHGITTGLPKSEGLVTSTDDLRPISVGPTISRLLNKIMADRLSTLLVRHQVLDKAQFAFLPGGDIHEPISSAIACYRDRKAHEKALYAIYYDISKAYDTIRWSSIKEALERIGLGDDFVTFVMSSLQGTTLSMRTNRAGHVTPAIEMHKAIKQGCPLAPLLFVIVMDELHCALREHHTGYTIKNPLRARKWKVTSRGYCDDTCIFAGTMKELRAMNATVHSFFQKHGLIISEKKTKITGRHADGSPLTESVVWPGSNKPFEVVPPDKPIKHLGCLITVDLEWSAQINKMNACVLTTISHLKSGRLTTFQAAILSKHVTGKNGNWHATCGYPLQPHGPLGHLACSCPCHPRGAWIHQPSSLWCGNGVPPDPTN
jgi:hypothetical protein